MAAGPRWSARKVNRLRQLQVFCRVAEMKSITRGAAAVGLSQPAVSAQIRELEFEMEATLLERYGPRIGLTPAGECLYELARPLVERLERISVDLAERMDENLSGELRVGAGAAAITFVLPSFIKRFRDEYPGIRLKLERVLADDSHALLRGGEVDFLCGLPRPKDERFFYHPLFTWELVLITPQDHPLAGRESVDIPDISGHPGIVPPHGTFSRDFGESLARRFGVTVNPAIETSGWGVIKAHVEAGLGISVVPSLCVSERDRLSVIPFGQYAKPRSYGVTIRRDAPLAAPREAIPRDAGPGVPVPPPVTAAGRAAARPFRSGHTDKLSRLADGPARRRPCAGKDSGPWWVARYWSAGT